MALHTTVAAGPSKLPGIDTLCLVVSGIGCQKFVKPHRVTGFVNTYPGSPQL